MSDIQNLDEPNEPERDNLRELREAADRGREAVTRAETVERELAFVKAGIDTDSGVGKLLFQSYKGEATKDAVIAAAAEYGIAPAAAQQIEAPPVVVDEAERGQARERANLAAAAADPGAQPPDEDPHEAGIREFHKARAAGASQDDAADQYFGRVLKAAYVDGDPRALYSEHQWKSDNAGSSRPG